MTEEANFGTIVGSACGVPAYSNKVVLPYKGLKIYTGLYGHHMEFARRYQILTRGVTFGQVDFSYQLWDLTHVTNVISGETYKLLSFANG